MGALSLGASTRSGLIWDAMTAADDVFVYQLFVADHQAMLAHATIPADVMAELMRLQFNMQHATWNDQFPDAKATILRQAGEPIGRMVTDRGRGHLYLVDLTLLPEVRNHGLGGQILDDLKAQAAADGSVLQTHVAADNPALTLLLRKGFRIEDDSHFYYRLAWLPDSGRS